MELMKSKKWPGREVSGLEIMEDTKSRKKYNFNYLNPFKVTILAVACRGFNSCLVLTVLYASFICLSEVVRFSSKSVMQ